MDFSAGIGSPARGWLTTAEECSLSLRERVRVRGNRLCPDRRSSTTPEALVVEPSHELTSRSGVSAKRRIRPEVAHTAAFYRDAATTGLIVPPRLSGILHPYL
jgi:hypothetical protein